MCVDICPSKDCLMKQIINSIRDIYFNDYILSHNSQKYIKTEH